MLTGTVVGKVAFSTLENQNTFKLNYLLKVRKDELHYWLDEKIKQNDFVRFRGFFTLKTI